VHRRVTTRRPARSHLKKCRVVGVAYVDMASRNIWALGLRMAPQAKVGVIRDEHLLIDGTVRVMAHRAALPQRFVLENKRARLILVALRTALVLLRHRQAARWFENVTAMRVVAVHATHVAFDDRMMLRQVEFALHVQVALEARVRFFPGIDDETGRATGPDMFTAGPVTGFATAHARHRRILNMQARVRAGGKFPDDLRMAIRTGLVAHVVGAGNFQRCHHRRSGRTGNQKERQATRKSHKDSRCPRSMRFQ
jgi:hypothetical protein